MNELPCIGAGITIVDPGPVRIERQSIYTPRRHRDGARLLRVLVERIDTERSRIYGGLVPPSIYWRAGARTGHVSASQEGTEWVRGHGPQARAALLAARKLAGLD